MCPALLLDSSMDVSISEYERSFQKRSKLQSTYLILRDKKWHCRNHAYRSIGSSQIAGSGGIMGLKKGTRSRPGLQLQYERRHCKKCAQLFFHDRWTGEFVLQHPSSSLSPKLQKQILKCCKYRDVIDQTKKHPKDFTIDHKLPMIRWPPGYGDIDKSDMTNAQIKQRFQLFKGIHSSMSVNLLKSRACERCVRTNKRGTPFGISFFYKGDENWGSFSKFDERGCHGCGWYDFAKWRNALNRFIKER